MSNKSLFTLALAILATSFCSVADAQLIAYEGFDAGGSDAVLPGTAATGSGFTGTWTNSSNNGGGSMYRAAGLSYPASYPGTHTAIGGHGQVTGVTGDNAFHRLDLDAAANTAVNSASEVHISFLAERVGDSTTTYDGCATCPLDPSVRTAFNLASEYPRNFGARIMNSASGNNALGTIGKGSDWNSNGVMFGDPNPLIIDTWGAGGWNDVNRVYTGADFADGIDHLVLSVDTATSAYRLQVNPQMDGTNDGEINFIHTDGAVVPFEMFGFGVEAGNDSSDRAPGDFVIDEIYVASTFEAAAGFVQVPEPSSFALIASVLVGLGAFRRRG